MTKLLIFMGTTIGSYVGWWAGESLGFGFMGDFVISSIASLIGLIVAWKIAVDYLEQ